MELTFLWGEADKEQIYTYSDSIKYLKKDSEEDRVYQGVAVLKKKCLSDVSRNLLGGSGEIFIVLSKGWLW